MDLTIKPIKLTHKQKELENDFINNMIDVETESDLAIQHQLADTLLTNLLTQLGYIEIIERYEALEKHYNI